MHLYIVPFSLLCLVLLSPVYSFITWYIMRRIGRKERRFTGFLTWALIIQAATVPFFWLLHFLGAFLFVETPDGHFDPVNITGHEGGFFTVYFLFTGILTIIGLTLTKWKSI